MIRVNVSAQCRRSRNLTTCADFARAARLTGLAVLDAIDAVETAADIAVELHNHDHSRRRFGLLPA